MITKFHISEDDLLENAEKYGWVLDGEGGANKIYNREIHLNEGDRVLLDNGSPFSIIDWKCSYFDEDVIEYSLREE